MISVALSSTGRWRWGCWPWCWYPPGRPAPWHPYIHGRRVAATVEWPDRGSSCGTSAFLCAGGGAGHVHLIPKRNRPCVGFRSNPGSSILFHIDVYIEERKYIVLPFKASSHICSLRKKKTLSVRLSVNHLWTRHGCGGGLRWCRRSAFYILKRS
jgi:hypothetical protein